MSKGTGERQETERTRHVDAAVSRRFRELREALGLTRRQVAADMGASEGRWQAYESGQRIPASRIWQFCRRYGLDVSAVYAGLPFTIGPVGEDAADARGEVPVDTGGSIAPGLVAGMAEEGAPFEPVSGNPHDPAPDDAALRAIAEVAADLSPLERNLALAALKGIRSHKANRS
ncbi:MAG: XRE family transcriptional regulator [Caulobacteraceae bacterium]|nr:XRE family transcriptional regulator [Caulobacteraceae bacterium]